MVAFVALMASCDDDYVEIDSCRCLVKNFLPEKLLMLVCQ